MGDFPEVQDGVCWYCGSIHNEQAGINEPGTPTKGAVMVCFKCGALAVLSENGEAVRPSKEVADTIFADATFRNDWAQAMYMRAMFQIENGP